MAHALSNAAVPDAPAPRWRARMRWALAFLLTILLGAIGGALSATGKPQLIAVFFGMVLVALILASRSALIWFVLVGGLVVSGVCQLYLPQLKYVRYVVPLASAPLLLHAIMDYLLSWTRERQVQMPVTMRWALAFVLTSVVTVLINLSDPAVALVGAKGYFQMWGLFLSVAYIRWPESFSKTMLYGLVVIALLQLPFVAHEYLVIAPHRVSPGFVPVDIVAGTFGGLLNGGGATMVLAVFQVIVVGWLLALWKNGALSGLIVAIAAPLLLSPMLVNEAKIIVLFLPLMFGVLFYRDMVAKPLKFMAAGAGLLGVLALLMTALVTSQASSKIQTWSDLVQIVVERQSDDSGDRSGHFGELTRLTALTFWAQEHVAANPVYTLLGHGLGASRDAAGGLDVVDTLAEKRYGGMNIGYTGLSALLWDTGIIGLVTVLGMFAAAFFSAGRLARHYRGTDRFRTALFEGLQSAVAVLTLSLASRDYFVAHIPFQTIVYLLLGFIVYAEISVASDDGNRRRA
jgi:hypothetical protein